MTIKRSCPDNQPHVDHYWDDSWCRGVDTKEVAQKKVRDHVDGLLNEYFFEIDDNGLEAESYSQSRFALAEDFAIWMTIRE